MKNGSNQKAYFSSFPFFPLFFGFMSSIYIYIYNHVFQLLSMGGFLGVTSCFQTKLYCLGWQ